MKRLPLLCVAALMLAGLCAVLAWWWRDDESEEYDLAAQPTPPATKTAQANTAATAGVPGMVYYPPEEVWVRGDPLHRELTAVVLSKLPILRVRLNDYSNATNLTKLLTLPRHKVQFAADLCDLLGIPARRRAVVTRYNKVLASMAEAGQTQPERALQRIYIYDTWALKDSLRKGGEAPYFTYSKERDKMTFEWYLKNAWAAGDRLDIPVVLLYDDAKVPYVQFADDIFEKTWLPVLKEQIEVKNGYRYYVLLARIVEDTLAEEIPNLPAWLRVGLAHHITLSIGVDKLEKEIGQFCFNDLVAAHPKPAPEASAVDLEAWTPQGPGQQSRQDGIYILAAAHVCERLTRKAGNRQWISRVATAFRSAGKEPTPAEVREIFQAQCDVPLDTILPGSAGI